MGVYIENMEMPTERESFNLTIKYNGTVLDTETGMQVAEAYELPPHGKLKKRIVYRGEVYNALEAARINSLDGILTDPYKEGFHDGLKRAIQILANEVEDAPVIVPAEQEKPREIKWREWNYLVPREGET